MNGDLLIRFLAGGAVLLATGPLMLFCFFPGVVRAWFEAGPEGIDAAAPPLAREVVASLTQMGFQPLGVKIEKTPLRAPVRELSFVAADRRCYAAVAVNRLRAPFYFYTPLPTGGLVLTSNGAFPRISTPRLVQCSYPGGEPQAILDHHLQALASLGQGGEVDPNPEARIEATYTYYRAPEVRSVLRRTGGVVLIFVILVGWLLTRG